MPSMPLSADRKAIVQLHTCLDVEAIDITKDRTERPAAVTRLVQLVPPARVDLVNEVMCRVGCRAADTLDWLPYATVCELAAKVKAVHLGEVRMQGGVR